MSLAVAYLLVLPPGWPGFAWALVSAVFVCSGVSREVLGVFLLWLVPPVIGAFAPTLGIPHLGAGLSIVGLVLLLCFGSPAPIVRMRWRAPILWLLWTLGVLVLAYFRGPESEYSRYKLARFAFYLPLAVLAFSFLVGSKSANLWALGILSIVGSVLYYSAMACAVPQFLPSSIWAPCGVRLLDVSGVDEIQPSILPLCSLAGFGIALLLCGSANTHSSRRLFTFLMLMAIGAGMLVINSGGERKWMVIIPVASVCAMLGKPRSVTVPVTVLVLSCVALAAFVVAGLLHENKFITNPLDTERTALSRVNRDTNWHAAARRLEERPLLGHGLGGYYVDGGTRPGKHDYAHNLLLELLSETGIVGTVLIAAPLAGFFLIPRRKQLWAFTTRNGTHLLPVLVAIAAISMTRGDLTLSYQLFALLAVMWMYRTPGGEAATSTTVQHRLKKSSSWRP